MLNLITIQGRFTADPEVKNMPSGSKLCQITLACERPKNKNGEKNTDFVPCMAWGKTADFISNYFHKGDMVIISGRLQSRNYQTQDGAKRTAYEVSISEVNFCGSTAPRQQEQKPVAPKSELQEDYDSINWDEIPTLPDEF